MMKTVSLAAAALVMTGAIAAAPASAQSYYGDHYQQIDHDGDRYGDNRRGYRGDQRGYDRRDGGERGYDRGYDRREYSDRRYDRRRFRPNRCSSDGGTILGAIAGGLLGNSVAGRGDRGVGTVLGAGAGALAGRAIDRSGNPRDCR